MAREDVGGVVAAAGSDADDAGAADRGRDWLDLSSAMQGPEAEDGSRRCEGLSMEERLA